MTPQELWDGNPSEAIRVLGDNACHAIEIVALLEERGLDPSLLDDLDESIESGFLLWQVKPIHQILIRDKEVNLDGYAGSISPTASCYTALALRVANDALELSRCEEPVEELRKYLRYNSAVGYAVGRHLLNLAAKVRCECQAAVAKMQSKQVAHSPDFRSVRWFGRTYAFTVNQAPVVKMLLENWRSGTPDVGSETLLLGVDHDAPPARLNALFRDHPAWGTMIVSGGTKGTHCLVRPDEKKS